MARKKLKCGICGAPDTPENRLNWDHIIPKSLGGPHDKWNLRLTCRGCNSARGNTFTEEDEALAASRKRAFDAGQKRKAA